MSKRENLKQSEIIAGNVSKSSKIESPEGQEFQHPDHNLIAKKFLISKSVTSEMYGSPNVYQSAVNLYASLYNPEEIDQLVNSNSKYPDRIPTMKQGLNIKPSKIPTKSEFIEKVRHAAVNEVNFGECLSEQARDQFKSVMEKSEHTVIWTDGDAEGNLEHELPGSKEQLKKLAAAQFYNRARKEIANERGVHCADVMSVVAIEGKMKFIPVIVERFLQMGIKKIVIVEDRVKNLIKAMELIRQISPNIETFPVWVRVGQWKDAVDEGMILENCAKNFHAIENISGLASTLEENNVFKEGVKVGSIFDLDGPLHDDDIRKKLQSDAVVKALQEKGWI